MMREWLRDADFWRALRDTTPDYFAHFDRLYREALARIARARHERHHTRRPGGLRARRQERRERSEAGYCRHGSYVGGCGADYICGACENGERWLSSPFTKSERVHLEREWEAMTPSEQAFNIEYAPESARG